MSLRLWKAHKNSMIPNVIVTWARDLLEQTKIVFKTLFIMILMIFKIG